MIVKPALVTFMISTVDLSAVNIDTPNMVPYTHVPTHECTHARPHTHTTHTHTHTQQTHYALPRHC